MTEKEPVYFKEFRKSFSEFRVEVNEKFENIDKKFEEIIENQDIHFETIGELKVQVTGIELMLKEKADYGYVKDIENPTEKLEKAVFA